MAKKNLAQQAVESQAEMKEEMFPAVSKETEVISLDFDGIKEQELHQLAKDYANLVVTEEKASFDAGKKARLALRNERYNIQNIVKEKKAILNEVKKKIEDKGDKYISIILPAEEHIDSQIKEIEAEQNRIKEEKRLAEEERKRKLQEESVAYVEAWRQKVRECTTTSALKKLAKEMENAVVPDFEDYYNGVVIHINNIIESEIPERSHILLKESELAKQQAENEKLRKQLMELEKDKTRNETVESEEPLGYQGIPDDTVTFYVKEAKKTEEFLRDSSASMHIVVPFDLATNTAVTDLVKEVNSRLEEVQNFMNKEIDKLFPKD